MSERRGVMTKTTHAGDGSEPGQAATGAQAGRGRRLNVWRVLALAGVLGFVPLVTGPLRVSSKVSPHPVKAQRHEVGFVTKSVFSMRVANNATSSARSTLAEPENGRAPVRTPGTP